MPLVDCKVRVGSAEFNDGSDPALNDEPVILAGLQVVWGRSTTIDQPEASTCKFRVIDPTAASDSLAQLVAGATVDVDASGEIFPAPTNSTFTNAALTTLDTISLVGGAATLVAGGGVDVDHKPRADRGWSMTLYPAPPSTNPAGWDSIATTSAGQTWQSTVTLTAPAGVSFRITPLAFRTADGVNPVRLTQYGRDYIAAAPYTAQTLTLSIPVDVDGAWLGLSIETLNPGYQWGTIGTVTWAQAATWPTLSGYTWQQYSRVRVSHADILSPLSGTVRTVRVFSGRITDMQAQYDVSVPGLAVDVTATDFTADLDNRRVGDEPWLVEPFPDRFQRIIDLADPNVTTILDATLTYLVSWVDVDSQPAMSLLRDLTSSVDGVLWSATHATLGAYLLVEDPALRPGGRVLREQNGVVIITVDVAQMSDALLISSCDVLRDPIQWQQDVTDVVTRVSVTWQEQGVAGPDMSTTERTETFRDPLAEQSYGVRNVSLSSDLVSAADALQVAQQLQARTSGLGWRASGLVIDAEHVEAPDAAAVDMLCELLDGTTRIARLLAITDLPRWVPDITVVGDDMAVYLEGGEYEYDGDGWILSLVASSARATGKSATWAELDPGWSWAMFDPSITWASLRGAIVGETITSTPAYPGLAYPGVTYPGATVRAGIVERQTGPRLLLNDFAERE